MVFETDPDPAQVTETLSTVTEIFFGIVTVIVAPMHWATWLGCRVKVD